MEYVVYQGSMFALQKYKKQPLGLKRIRMS